MERRFIPADEVLAAMVDLQQSLGEIADRAAHGKPVAPEMVTAAYRAIEPICGELVSRMTEQTSHPKIENGI